MQKVSVPSDRLEQWTLRAADRAETLARRERLAATLLERARHLPQHQQSLLRMVLSHRLRLREVALVTGENPGTICRRVRTLLRRLSDPVIAAVADSTCTLDEDDRQLFLGSVLRREPVAVLARRTGLSRAEVRRRLQWVRGWALGRREGARAAGTIRRSTRPR